MSTLQAEDLAKEQATIGCSIEAGTHDGSKDSLFRKPAVDGGGVSLNSNTFGETNNVADESLVPKLNKTPGGRDNEAERVRALLVESGRSTEVKFAVGDRVKRNHDDKEGEVVAVEGENPKIMFDGEPKTVQYRYKRALILLARVTEATSRQALLAQNLAKCSEPPTSRSSTKLSNADDFNRVCSKEVACDDDSNTAKEGKLPVGGGLGYSMSARVDGPDGNDMLGRRTLAVASPSSVTKARSSSFSGGPMLEDMRQTTVLMNQAAAAEASMPASPRTKPTAPKDSGKSRQCSRFACTVGENDLCDGDEDEDEIHVMHRPSQYHAADTASWRLR